MCRLLRENNCLQVYSVKVKYFSLEDLGNFKLTKYAFLKISMYDIKHSKQAFSLDMKHSFIKLYADSISWHLWEASKLLKLFDFSLSIIHFKLILSQFNLNIAQEIQKMIVFSNMNNEIESGYDLHA